MQPSEKSSPMECLMVASAVQGQMHLRRTQRRHLAMMSLAALQET